MSQKGWKKLVVDLVVDLVGSLLISVGIYNFAAASEFPVTGVSGIALVLHHFFGVPIGACTFALNIPIIIICSRILGKTFILRSVKTMTIYSIFLDLVAPFFPIYKGDLILSAVCMGILAGTGYALIYMRDSSTGGVDFITMSIRAKLPYLSLGRIIIVIDCTVLVSCGLLLGGNVNRIIYGMIGAYIVSVVVDKIMYGMDAGKVTFIVTSCGQAVSERIHELLDRGATILNATGSYTGDEKQVVMCACSYKQMHLVQKAVKEADTSAFLITMEANQVRGQGFRPY